MKLTKKEKVQKLVILFELLVYCGYDLTTYIGVLINHYDYNKVDELIKNLEIEKNKIDE
jgi:hypothetical protein